MSFKVILFTVGLFTVMFFSFTTSFAFAHPHSGQILIDDHDHVHKPQTETILLSGMYST